MMMVKRIGDNISMSEYNSLVYLLRKFKRIVRHETINKVLKTDIGTLNFTSGFINVGDNFILENDVNIISQNCLPLTHYFFTFYIVNVDTSESVLETPVTLSGDTDKYGNLEITIPENLLNPGEEIRRDIKIEVTFQEHESISPTRLLNLTLRTDKKYIYDGVAATVTATLLDTDDEPLAGYTVYFDVNGVIVSKITNNDGEAVLTINGTGNTGLINVKVLNEEINIIDYYFYDPATYAEHNNNYFTGEWQISYLENSTTIETPEKNESIFCPSIVPTVSDFSQKLEFNTPYAMEFDINFSTGNIYLQVFDESQNIYFNHLIVDGGHYKLIVKENIIQLWLNGTLIEELVDINESTSVGFVNMKNNGGMPILLEFADLIIYQQDIIEPPLHVYDLELSGASVIESGDTATVTCTLSSDGSPVSGEILNYMIKHGETIIYDGSTTATDSNGQTTINYIGSGVGDVDVIVYSSELTVRENFIIEDCYKYVSDFSSWIGNSPVFSDFVLPTNHKLTVKLKNTNGVQIGCSNTSNSWIYAWNLNYYNSTSVNYKSSNNAVITDTTGVVIDSDKEYSIVMDGNTLELYEDDTLISTKTTYDVLGIERRVRFYDNANVVDYLKVKSLE